MSQETPKRGRPPQEGEAAITEYLARIGRKGGKRVTRAKRQANRERILKYWQDVRAGIRQKPNHKQKEKGTN